MSRPGLLDRAALPVAHWHARRVLNAFFAAACRARRTQADVLRSKLRRNADSAFGRAHDFNRISSPDDFTRRVPIQTYDSLAPYLDRVRDGDTAALLGRNQRVLMFALTSGTAGSPKHIPVTPAFLAEYRRGWNAWGLRALLDHPGCFLRSILQVSSPMDESRTPAGAPCGAITGLMAATQKRLVRKYYTSPAALARIADPTARYYAIMRFAVARDVAFAIAANPATLLLLARTADEHRETLVRDLHDGTLCEQFDIAGAVRSAVRPHLAPDRPAARRLGDIIAATQRLRPRDYWNLGFLAHWTGASMGLYRPRFAEWFGDVPVRDPGLLASEGRMAIPIADNTATGVLDVASHFFEFIPADEYESPRREALGIDRLSEGQEYFILLTTSSGLCRYDIGDRVRVTGWQGEAPLIEFVGKAAHTASIAGEKLTEAQAVAAARALAEAGGPRLSRFLLAPQFADPPYYRLFVDRTALPTADAAQFDRLAGEFDRQLIALNVEYASKRETLRLGRVQLCPLPEGALQRYDDQTRASQRGRYEQFKPRILLTQCGDDAPLLASLPPPRPS